MNENFCEKIGKQFVILKALIDEFNLALGKDQKEYNREDLKGLKTAIENLCGELSYSLIPEVKSLREVADKISEVKKLFI